MRDSGRLHRLCALLSAIIGIAISQQSSFAGTCPCDIYATGGTPCVAAHSTVRALYSTYNGPLYQVTRKSDSKTKDIGVLSPGGLANSAAQDSFLTGTTGSISIIYDQSGQGNHLYPAPSGNWPPAETAAAATGAKIMMNGHTVYGIYTTAGNFPNNTLVAGVGYRNNKATGLATGNQPEGMYMVCSGTHYNQWCCFDYGNAEANDTDDGNATMECIYFGSSTQWGHGDTLPTKGPWVMADLENGLFAGGTSGTNNGNTPIAASYVTGMVKGDSGNRYAIKGGNADSGSLKTMYNGTRPSGYNPMKKQGAIILGIGGDNSHTAIGTFFEGAITTGYPPDSTENAIQANIVAARYGSSVTATRYSVNDEVPVSPVRVHYNPSSGSAVVSYFLQDARRVSMNIADLQGRQVAAIFDGVIPAGQHQAVWNARQVPAGVYVWRIAMDGRDGWSGKIVIER